MMQKNVIIVAGGSGSRMNSDIPKQFILINNLPILMHTIQKFYQFDKLMKIVLVLPENQFEYWYKLVNIYYFKIQVEIAKGGKTRFDSVKNGLAFVKDGIVGIHDAVRPLVNINTISKVYKMAEEMGNAVPVIPVNDSVRVLSEFGNMHFDRNNMKIVQTPQCFDVDLLKKAYLQDYNNQFTDDASVVENLGIKINLTEGNLENIKITTPFDLKLAKALI